MGRKRALELYNMEQNIYNGWPYCLERGRIPWIKELLKRLKRESGEVQSDTDEE